MSNLAQQLCKMLHDEQKRQGITQKDLAKQSGVSQSRISEMFSGKYVPLLSTFVKVAMVLKIKTIILTPDTITDLGDIREGMSIVEIIEYEGCYD